MISDVLADEFSADDRDFDMENDLEYLLGLAGETVEDDTFEDDFERARWVVAQWCAELRCIPDLRGYETGECVPTDEVPECNWRAFCYRADGETDRRAQEGGR